MTNQACMYEQVLKALPCYMPPFLSSPLGFCSSVSQLRDSPVGQSSNPVGLIQKLKGLICIQTCAPVLLLLCFGQVFGSDTVLTWLQSQCCMQFANPGPHPGTGAFPLSLPKAQIRLQRTLRGRRALRL